MGYGASLDRLAKPTWWSAAIYQRQATGAYRFLGYTQPRWQTWGEYFQALPTGDGIKAYGFRWNEASGKWERHP